MVEVLDSPSILLTDMQGSKMPIVIAHGEGRAEHQDKISSQSAIATLRYIDNAGINTENYPANPNGSPLGQTGFTTADGRFTIMMPHPERVFLSQQYSWLPDDWHQENSPWMRMFYNARKWLG